MAQRQAVLADFKENTMNFKKTLAGATILLALTTSVFAAKAKKSDNKKLKVVTTIFPEYDWTREILGDNINNAELTLLIGNGVDLHSYQPSIQDIAKISTADIFIYVGGESDGWVKDALKNAINKNMKVINLIEVLGDKVKAEEVKEGMQAEEEEEHEHHHHHDEDVEEAAHHHHSVAFKDSDVKDRSLSEFQGEWTSAYVYYKDGSLDSAIAFTANQEPKTDLSLLRSCYDQGLKTSIDYINIKGSNVSFTINGKTSEAKYGYAGYRIVQYTAGNRGVRYFFEVKGKTNGCPKYIGFNDHMIAPTKPEHYHFYSSNVSIDDMCKESDNWPTYFPKNYSKDEVSKAFAGYNPMAHHADADHDHDHDHDHHEAEGHHHHHDDEEEVEYDEHVWLSLKNTKILSSEIASALCEKDSANAAAYKANLSAFASKLDALDAKYTAAVKAGNKHTILFGDRFPFRYLVDDYNLDYFAAFVGCSAETEASFETVIFLAKKVDELGLNTVLKIESGDGKIARTIVQNTKKKNAKVLTMDSIQSTTAKQAATGTTYLKIMEANLETLTEALK